jgi:translation initiation factor IF-3
MINRKNKLNEEVRFPQVRLIGDGEPRLMSSYEAFQLAKSQNLDLILVNDNQNPPIVRIADYQKFLYLQEKAEKERMRNARKSEQKEVQLSCDIAENDLQTKANHTRKFLEKGDKVKVVLALHGRQKSTPHRGETTMFNFIERITEYGDIESPLKLEGSRWIVSLKPKKKSL